MISGSQKPHIPSIAQFVLSGLGLLALWGLALVYVVMGVVDFSAANQNSQTASLFLVAIDFFVLGLLVLPSLVFSLMRMINHPLSNPISRTPRFQLAIILLWPLILYLGNLFIQAEDWSAYLFPVTQVLAVLLLVYWFFSIATLGMIRTSPQRSWGLLASGMFGGTGLSILIELLGILLLLIGFIALVILIPSLQDEINRLATRISTVGNDMDALMRILTPYFSKPAIIISLILSTSIIVPLIEEALKPVGLWFLSRKNLSSAEGFMGGVISGAGFAIVESLFNTAQVMGDTWILVSSMRFGTTLIHMLASGLVGWGLAGAWTQRKYLRLAGAYLGAVILHGGWNAMAIFFSVNQLSSTQPPVSLISSSKLLIVGLGVWALIAFILLLFVNSQLRKCKPLPLI